MKTSSALKPKHVYLVANGDLRLSANQKCWPAQAKMEATLARAFQAEGWKVVRAHAWDKTKKHGFIDSQKMGMEVFRALDPDAPLIVAESVWQYSQHLLPGLFTHRGPLLTVANWSGTWPGLVGMLNLNGSLTKMGVRYSSLWSETFADRFFKDGLRQWLAEGTVTHDQSHVKDLALLKLPLADEQFGRRVARQFQRQKAILGVFDEGCMGMHNAIIPDELLNPTGVFKERLSQSALYAAMLQVPEAEAQAVYAWLKKKGMQFVLGPNEETDLTENQILQQCKMYVAAVRLADEFGCAAIGIQYQQGLKDLAPASDLAEGLLNNADRPPVQCPNTGRILFEGEAVPHFNEVDECAGLDGLLTYRLWRELGFAPENTLHDLRWGQHYKGPGRDVASALPRRKNAVLDASQHLDEYVWVFLISGAAPPAHFIGGFKGARSERQPPMYFRLGGGTVKGISKPGHIVWSRVFVMDGKLHCDLGVGKVVELPLQETERRWCETTPQWPIMHAVLNGITRDQMMARHKSNHIQVVYAPNERQAHRAVRIKAALLAELGLAVHLCGKVNLE
ncbi:MAG: fucose isomerase [Verrucomicrobiota bacterium]